MFVKIEQMNFGLTDLRVFEAVAEAKSMTKGAEKCFLSKSSVSLRIKSLETTLNCRLLYRHSQGVELTPSGKLLLQQARQLNERVESIKTQFLHNSDDQRGHVRVFANTTAILDFLPKILSQFLAERPAVTIDLQEQITDHVIRAVLNGATDIGIISGDANIEGLETIHFSTDRLIVVVPYKHRLAKQRTVRFADTLNYPHIGLHSGSTLQAFIDDKFIQSGVIASHRIRVFGFDAMCKLIEGNVGIGIVPESATLHLKQSMDIETIYLSEKWATRERNIIIKDRTSLLPVATSLIKTICQAMKLD